MSFLDFLFFVLVVILYFFFLHFLSNQTGRFRMDAVRMQNRYMERSNSVAREKRGLDSTSAEEAQPERKRPALAKYFLL